MKTKLLLFFLWAFSFANAQFNISEGFESGLAPAGWTSQGGITTTPVVATSTCSGSYILRGDFMGVGNNFVIIYTSSYISNGNSIATSFKFRADTFTGAVNIYFYYELNGSGNWNLIGSDGIIDSACRTVSATLAAGVIPSGASVKFRMQINSTNTSVRPYFDDFSAVQTGAAPPTQIVADYTFDNTYFNTSGTLPFANYPATTSFVPDRNNIPNNALQVLGNDNGTFSNLFAPTGASPRTISFWYKTAGHAGFKSLFSYGLANQYQTFGTYFGPTGNIFLQGFSYDHDFEGSYALNTWRHLVITFDGSDVKLYMNGALVGSVARPLLNTGSPSNFKLGNNGVTMVFDDLKIYNSALNQSQVTSLFTNNSLSSNDFAQSNLKVILYPNPVSNMLNIEMESELKSVEIYNMQGQKVVTSSQKQVNVSHFSTGVYLVQVKNQALETATKRIIIGIK